MPWATTWLERNQSMTEAPKYPPGIFARGPTLWMRFNVHGQEIRETTKLPLSKVKEAVRLRGRRIAEYERGETTKAADKLRMHDAFDLVVRDYELRDLASMETLRGHLKFLRPELGDIPLLLFNAADAERVMLKWKKAGVTHPTINKRMNVVRRALRLASQKRLVHFVPYIAKLQERKSVPKAIAPELADRLEAALPDYAAPHFRVAYELGIRKGQLARTLRRYVDLTHDVIAWPSDEVKNDRPHVVPLTGVVLEIVRGLMSRPPLHCPYLFHGPRCKPGHKRHPKYACVGDWKKSWRAACAAVGIPAGRKNDGYVFHNTRNSAATNFRAYQDMTEGEAMAVGGWKTASVYRHYDRKHIEQLRAKLARPRQSTLTRRGDTA
jgi:integrase